MSGKADGKGQGIQASKKVPLIRYQSAAIAVEESGRIIRPARSASCAKNIWLGRSKR